MGDSRWIRRLRPVQEPDLDTDDSVRDLDADDLTDQCQRLVILGGPGSGKTWLAKRTARRCAQDALKALAAGESVDEVELPLYTTCYALFRAPGDIREATVSSALHQLGDLGGSRTSAALLESFTERNAPTVLVIDGLDEVYGSAERLRQADTLPWRIVLMGRPSSWNDQLVIEEKNDSHRVGELRPLRYPEDVRHSSGAGLASDPSGARILPPRSRGGPTCSRLRPCRWSWPFTASWVAAECYQSSGATCIQRCSTGSSAAAGAAVTIAGPTWTLVSERSGLGLGWGQPVTQSPVSGCGWTTSRPSVAAVRGRRGRARSRRCACRPA